ncbi:MAG: putative lipid II flippase FtsW [Verrucomicrobiales bacterium]|nr:putative lipid II flippase FtsW [Verrucomicrobiales bacterium]|tara:strand:+ start:3200 stop:4411 length:1212 start_codon:yes stop_codon:yes gene_type:complete
MARKTKRNRKPVNSTGSYPVQSLGNANMRQVATVLAFAVAALVALGMVILYSASMSDQGMRLLVKQAQWLGLGMCGCLFVALVDYRVWRKHAWWILAAAIVLLALVLVPGIGHKIGGARRWFKIGGVSFQPSELAKIAILIWAAFYCEWQTRNMKNFKEGILYPSTIMGVVLTLILVEPDRGTFILMSAVCAGVLCVGGVKLYYLAVPVLVGALSVGYLLATDPLRMRRITSWLRPEETRDGVGYQAYQSMIAMGSGGVTGVGLGDGRQKMGFVPENLTDFIFSVIGEELGLIATLGVLLGFALITICGMTIAWKARDRFGYFLATGITFLIGAQACVNIGVVTSALPNKGMSLPFISYGGSNLLMMLVCVGFLISIARHATDDAVVVDEDSSGTVFMAAARA